MTVTAASQPATPVNFSIPAGACDTHTHIYGDPARFPMWPGRSYTPPPALPEEMSELHRALHMTRVVIVNSLVYDRDNSATLYGMEARGGTARGIALIDDRTSEGDLDRMDRAGFRGIRLNFASTHITDPAVARARFARAAEITKRHRWHIQIYTGLELVAALKDVAEDSPVPVVFDHFGGVEAGRGLEQTGFRELVDMVGSGKAYVKISGAYRCSTQGPDYPDMVPFAQALISANADRVLWGTDWPHPDSSAPAGGRPSDVTPFYRIDDGRLLNQLAVWAPDAAVRHKILVDNPARLYGF